MEIIYNLVNAITIKEYIVIMIIIAIIVIIIDEIIKWYYNRHDLTTDYSQQQIKHKVVKCNKIQYLVIKCDEQLQPRKYQHIVEDYHVGKQIKFKDSELLIVDYAPVEVYDKLMGIKKSGIVFELSK